jgi:deoxyribonuclease V
MTFSEEDPTPSIDAYRLRVEMGWARDGGELDVIQEELARAAATTLRWWPPTDRPIAVAGSFVASTTSGPARCWVGACVLRPDRSVQESVTSGEPGAPYVPGHLALREGPLLERVVRELDASFDVLLVNATGRDHPRGAGLAVHLGAVLDIPTIGVTDRPLLAEPDGEPDEARGASVPVVLDAELVGFLVRTRARAKPVVVHAGWRTDPETARAVVLSVGGPARTPEPIRRARHLARIARAAAEGRRQEG